MFDKDEAKIPAQTAYKIEFQLMARANKVILALSLGEEEPELSIEHL